MAKHFFKADSGHTSAYDICLVARFCDDVIRGQAGMGSGFWQSFHKLSIFRESHCPWTRATSVIN